MYSFKHILNEAAWHETHSAYEALKPYAGKNLWVHFSDGVKDPKNHTKVMGYKMGVNPKKNHNDAHGIYFYPVDWILSNEHDGYSQYALSARSFYVAELKPGKNILDLSAMTEADAKEIATRNGWVKSYEILSTHYTEVTHKPCKSPGEKFYKIASFLTTISGSRRHFLVECPLLSWGQVFAGYDGLVDNGNGIIFPSEPHQMMVFKRNSVNIINFDLNKPDWKLQEQWLERMKTIDPEATVVWKNKLLDCYFKVGYASHHLVIDPKDHYLRISAGFKGIEVPYYNSIHDINAPGSGPADTNIREKLASMGTESLELFDNEPIIFKASWIALAFGINYRRLYGVANANGTVSFGARKNGSVQYDISLNSKDITITLSSYSFGYSHMYRLSEYSLASLQVIAQEFKQAVLDPVNGLYLPGNYRCIEDVTEAMQYEQATNYTRVRA